MYKDRAMEYIGRDEEVPRGSQVAEEMNELDAMISICQEMVDTLNGRLNPVLRDEVSSKAEVDSVPKRPLVPLASAIDEMRMRLHRVTNSLASIMERMEL